MTKTKELTARMKCFCIRFIFLRERRVTKEDFEMHMENRHFQPLHSIQTLAGNISQTGHHDIPGDWITVGVLVEKSPPKTATSGKKYCVFKLSDLKGTIVNVFLFGAVFEAHWKETVGAVLAILNPKVLSATDVCMLLCILFTFF
jgi:DNA polymerase III alpha subunit